jgi:hypothetical protein
MKRITPKLLATILVLSVSTVVLGADPAYKQATVNVDGCSGTLVYSKGNTTYGISCSHCCEPGKKIIVWFRDKTHIYGEWIDSDPTVDLAWFSVPTNKVKTVSIPDVMPKGKLLGFGNHGETELAGGSKETVDTTDAGPMLRVRYDIKKGKFKSGSSGGGVFVNNNLIGVSSHGDDKNMYCADHRQIRKFVRAMKGEPRLPEDWGDKDRTREILELKKIIADLKNKLDRIKSTPGPAGPAGPTGPSGSEGVEGSEGPAGRDGLIKVEIYREGELTKTVDGVRTGSTVRVKISKKE